MARLRLNDGFTLEDKTPEVNAANVEIPVLSFTYRPAMPEAIYSWQYDLRQAQSGPAILEVDAKFILAHLVKWDAVTAAPGGESEQAAPLNLANVKGTPKPYLDYLIHKISSWSAPPKKGESDKDKAEKNSEAAHG